MSDPGTELPSRQQDIEGIGIGKAETDEGPYDESANTMANQDSPHASMQTRTYPRAVQDLRIGPRRGREKAQLSCNTCRQRKSVSLLILPQNSS